MVSFVVDLISDVISWCLLKPFHLFRQGLAGAVRPTRDPQLANLQKVTGTFLIVGCGAFLGSIVLVAFLGYWRNGFLLFLVSFIPLSVASLLGARIERALDDQGKKAERR